MAEGRDVPAQSQEYRLRGPYGRMVYDAETKAWRTVEYKQEDMLTPTHEELAAHPDRFEVWPPAGTVLEGAKSTEDPAPDEPHRARSHR